MQEVSTCSYLLHIGTLQLCTHPGLNRGPSLASKIVCFRQQAHHLQQDGEELVSNLSSQEGQAQGTADQLLAKDLADVERDGFRSSSQAALAHGTLLNTLKEAGQLEAFENAVKSQAIAASEDEEDDDDDL